jgi:SsrA-binding protein
MDEKVIATNRKLFRDYEVLETLECGIELMGSEVKSLREARANLDESFARVEGSEIYLYSCHITPYEKASYFKADAIRPRRLLLHKTQIKRLIGQVQQKGFTLVPMKMYFNTRGLVKVALSLGKGKKIYDRRQDIKKRDEQREMRRSLRARNK